jgi:hypothetical protein
VLTQLLPGVLLLVILASTSVLQKLLGALNELISEFAPVQASNILADNGRGGQRLTTEILAIC